MEDGEFRNKEQGVRSKEEFRIEKKEKVRRLDGLTEKKKSKMDFCLPSGKEQAFAGMTRLRRRYAVARGPTSQELRRGKRPGFAGATPWQEARLRRSYAVASRASRE
jgi:hypothetical protein